MQPIFPQSITGLIISFDWERTLCRKNKKKTKQSQGFKRNRIWHWTTVLIGEQRLEKTPTVGTIDLGKKRTLDLEHGWARKHGCEAEGICLPRSMRGQGQEAGQLFREKLGQ